MSKQAVIKMPRLPKKTGLHILIITTNKDTPQRQASHYHLLITEVYKVKKGKVIIATEWKGKQEVIELQKDQKFTIEPEVHHSILILPDSILHVEIYGKYSRSDWHPSKNLDNFCQKL